MAPVVSGHPTMPATLSSEGERERETTCTDVISLARLDLYYVVISYARSCLCAEEGKKTSQHRLDRDHRRVSFLLFT